MKDSIDLVFVANNLKGSLWEMTRNAVRTAAKHASMPVGDIIIVEQSRYAREQPLGKTFYYDFEFNYNKCLNLGMSVCKSRYVAFCNNDLMFEANWAINAVKAMQKGDYLSASPTNKHIFAGIREGHTVGKMVLGWCIITDRAVFDKIGKFDEPVTFWYSDDVYADQLKRAGVKHILVGNSRVRHLGNGSVTLTKIAPKIRGEYMSKQRKVFDEYILSKSV